MNRDNLRAKLEDVDLKLSIESQIEEYEKLFESTNVSEVEQFVTKKETQTVVFEVRRRIELLKSLAEEVGMMKISERAESLLDTFE
jgi:hypothetical protein